VPEKVPQQKQALFRSDGVINMDLRSVQVSGQWIGNVPSHDTDSIETLQMFLDSRRVFCKPNLHRSIVREHGLSFPPGNVPNLEEAEGAPLIAHVAMSGFLP
jgi:hypothetical protein